MRIVFVPWIIGTLLRFLFNFDASDIDMDNIVISMLSKTYL